MKIHTGLENCEFCKGRKIQCFEVLMGRMRLNPLSNQMQLNLEDLLIKVNKFRDLYGKPMSVSSGYRPPAINAATPNAATHSAHQSCQAIDFHDLNNEIKNFINKDPSILVTCDLYREDPSATKTWTHLSNRAPASGHRTFMP